MHYGSLKVARSVIATIAAIITDVSAARTEDRITEISVTVGGCAHYCTVKVKIQKRKPGQSRSGSVGVMLEILSQIEIPAPPSLIWSLVVDFERYPTWQKAIAIKGKAAAGEAIIYSTNVQMPFAASKMVGMDGTITEVVPRQRLAWEFGVPVIYSAILTISVEPSGAGTKVIFSMLAKGLLPTLARGRLLRTHKPLMEAYTIALKARAARAPAKATPNRKARRRAR